MSTIDQATRSVLDSDADTELHLDLEDARNKGTRAPTATLHVLPIDTPTSARPHAFGEANAQTLRPAVTADHSPLSPALGLSRFRVPKKSESFIAPTPDSHDGIIRLVKRECPSLATFPADKLSVHVGFETDHPASAGVLYRVSPDIYPGAVTEQLKMVLIRKVQETEAGADADAAAMAPTVRTHSSMELGSRLEVVHETDEEDGSLCAASVASPASPLTPFSPLEDPTETWADLQARHALMGDH